MGEDKNPILQLVQENLKNSTFKSTDFKIIGNLMKVGGDFRDAMKLSIASNRKDIVDFFISNKINLNYNKGLFYSQAIINESKDVLDALLDKKGLKELKNPFKIALSMGNIDILKSLLNKSSDFSLIDIVSIEELDFFKDVETLINPLLNNEDKSKLLDFSIENKDEKKFNHLLKKGYQFSKDSFEKAIDSKSENIINSLVENGADISDVGIIKLNLAKDFMILKLLLDNDKIDAKKCLKFSLATDNNETSKYLLNNLFKDKKEPEKKEVHLIDVFDNGDIMAYINSLFSKKDDDIPTKIVKKMIKKEKNNEQ